MGFSIGVVVDRLVGPASLAVMGLYAALIGTPVVTSLRGKICARHTDGRGLSWS